LPRTWRTWRKRRRRICDERLNMPYIFTGPNLGILAIVVFLVHDDTITATTYYYYLLLRVDYKYIIFGDEHMEECLAILARAFQSHMLFVAPCGILRFLRTLPSKLINLNVPHRVDVETVE
jgi:hypothetical protein